MSPPRRAPHPFGDARTQRTGLPHSNAPGLLPRAAPRLSEPAWTRRVEARILHGTGDTMADAGGRPDAHRGPRTTGPHPAPSPTPQSTRAGAAGWLACCRYAAWEISTRTTVPIVLVALARGLAIATDVLRGRVVTVRSQRRRA